MASAYKYVFGPVASRRYGKSLGVDLVRMKTCTFSCRFCQLGPTPAAGHSARRVSDPPMSEILEELRRKLSGGDMPQFITAGGSGEPTLHLRFGDLFRFVKSETPCKALLLSNGSLFDRPEVRAEAALADVVKVSLSAWDLESFERLMRPARGVAPFEAIVEGYAEFRKMFAGRLDCEIFLVPGFNDGEDDCRRMAEIADSFAPDTISLNTAVRPGAENGIVPVPPERMKRLRAIFGPRAAETGAEPAAAPGAIEARPEAVASLVERHPVSLAALSAATGLAGEELLSLVAAAGATIADTPAGKFVERRNA